MFLFLLRSVFLLSRVFDVFSFFPLLYPAGILSLVKLFFYYCLCVFVYMSKVNRLV